jgi:UDP-N-acetylglucosamine 1-carboxyvinyltransferase
MQSFVVFLALFGNGTSRLWDYRYPERIAYAHELASFAPGAVEAEAGKITVHGPARLQGAEGTSTDLRGSMALIMAALCATGESRVSGVTLALRGYNDLPGKLARLGVQAQWG